MPLTARTSTATGSRTRVETPRQPSKLPKTLSAQRASATGSARCRASAWSRAALSRWRWASSSSSPWFRRWRILLPNCCSFIVTCRLVRTLLERNAARLKGGGQCVRGPGTVRLHTALRAPHGSGRLRNVELLPVTHDERFALTHRQPCDLLFNDFKDLSLLQAASR